MTGIIRLRDLLADKTKLEDSKLRDASQRKGLA